MSLPSTTTASFSTGAGTGRDLREHETVQFHGTTANSKGAIPVTGPIAPEWS